MWGVLGHYLGRIFATAAAAVLIYVAIKVARKIFYAYQEVFVLWTVLSGRRWMPKERNLRIQPYLCKTADLDEVSIEECFQFHYSAFQPADENMTRDQVFELYRKTLQSYSHVLFCREKLDGSLRGLVLVGLDHKKTHTLMKVGLILTHKNYRGGPWMKVVAVCLIMKELLLHPFVPVYMIAKLSTYKSYLLAMIMPDSQPRYDQEAPEEYKQIAEDFVRGVQSPGDEYDRETFVLRRRTVVVNEHLVSISERDLLNPHIRFFNERNPGWRKGDQLVVLARFTWRNLLLHFIKATLQQFRQQSSRDLPRGSAVGCSVNRKKATKLRARLARGMSYQDMEAGLHSLRFHAQERNEGEKNRDINIQRFYSH